MGEHPVSQRRGGIVGSLPKARLEAVIAHDADAVFCLVGVHIPGLAGYGSATFLVPKFVVLTATERMMVSVQDDGPTVILSVAQYLDEFRSVAQLDDAPIFHALSGDNPHGERDPPAVQVVYYLG